jgi:hypothetical protein
MEGTEETLFDGLDVTDNEVAPDPAPEPIAQPAETPAEPTVVVETAAVARDPATGKFVAQPPASMPDPQVPQVPAPQASEPTRVIPLAAHLEERARWRQQIEDGNRRLNEINEQLKALQPPPKPDPDFLEDPKGYVDAKTAAVEKEAAALREEANKLQGQQQFAAFQQEIVAREAAFVEKTPDYLEAVNHIRAIRFEQIRDDYPEATEQQILQAISQEELAAAAGYLQRGRNPAEAVYKIAQSYGYKKAEGAAAKAPPLKVEVPRAPVADPGATLGSSGDTTLDPDEMGDDDMAPFEEAIAERFGVRR